MAALQLCVIGDGIANGVGDRAQLGWAGRLARDFGGPHAISLYRLGVAGDTSRELAARWRNECAVRLTDRVPAGLIVSLGFNDMAEDVGEGIRVPLPESVHLAETIVAEAACWHATLWVGPTPVLRGGPQLTDLHGRVLRFRNERLAALNEAYLHIARDLAVPYLDLYALLTKDLRYRMALKVGDGVHPADDGHARIAEMVGRWPDWRRWIDQPPVALAPTRPTLFSPLSAAAM